MYSRSTALLLLLPLVATVAIFCLAVAPVSASSAAAAPAQKCPTSMFGVPKNHPLEARGGSQEETQDDNEADDAEEDAGDEEARGVLEATTLDEVESILSEAGSNDSLVVIDFSATWCGPCKAIAPIFAELAQDTTGVYFMKVDVDENPDTAAKYSVSAMPTFLFIKNGEVVDRLMGANPGRLGELIEQHK